MVVEQGFDMSAENYMLADMLVVLVSEHYKFVDTHMVAGMHKVVENYKVAETDMVFDMYADRVVEKHKVVEMDMCHLQVLPH